MISFPFLCNDQTNRTVENIGARRLHTVIERIVEEVSFDAPDKAGESVEIDEVRSFITVMVMHTIIQ